MTEKHLGGRATPMRFVLSGCSGGGKSTLLNELAARGFSTFAEPGRRIVKEQHSFGGRALPWLDPEAFALLAIDLALIDYRAASDLPGPVFYDRSFVDAVSFLEEEVGVPSDIHAEILVTHRYATPIFLTPPWPEIYVTDDERQADFESAVREYEAVRHFYTRHGYDVVIVPKAPVAVRADFILREIEIGKGLADQGCKD